MTLDSELDRLNTFMTERLMEAVKEIILTVSRTVREYEEETERVRSENIWLKEMLRDSGYFVEQTNAALQSCQSVSPGQPTWISSQNEDPESLKEIQQNQRQSEQYSHVKLEESVYFDDTWQEPADSPSNINNNTDSIVCVSDDDDEVLDFPTNIKVEHTSPNCSAEDIGDTEDEYQSWSPHSPDLSLGTADLSSSQHLDQPTCTTNEASSSLLKNSSLSINVHHISDHNIFCTSSSKCKSKCCELQKKATPKTSPVWRYFSLKEGDCSKAVCLVCKAVLSRGHKEYTTSPLLTHLRIKHVLQNGRPRPCCLAVLLFKSLIPLDIYQK
ncbi:uncharacterized protein [Paramisgurnus dabryanus]|uniref:uncharacterized protein n=1 Tax=Paramisgurnus dabryanus TaxID=90735 RepID=UPI0031F42AA4